MRFALGFALMSALIVPAHAQETGVAKPNLVLQQLIEGLPKDDKQAVRVLTATFKPGDQTVYHSHRFPVTVYVLEGTFELPVQGQPTRAIKRGDAFQIPPETPHAGGKPVDAKSIILITYVVEKGKPLASPAA